MGKKQKTKTQSWFETVGNLQILSLVLFISTMILLVLAGTAYADYQDLNHDITQKLERSFVPYTDELLGIEFDYPLGWAINTRTNLDSSYEDPDIPQGQIPDLAEFEVHVLKPETDTRLRFVHFFGPLEQKVVQLRTDLVQYKVIEDKLVRHQSQDLQKWYYAIPASCEDLSADFELNETLPEVICMTDYFPGFVEGPSRVVLEGFADINVLETTDAIVMSALNE